MARLELSSATVLLDHSNGALVRILIPCILAALCGCSTYAVPHQPYTPLLTRGGQVDISAYAGVTGGAVPTFAVHGAYAPIDHLEIVAGADFDPVGDKSLAETLHAAGELGIGTFVVDDPFMRVEAIAGLGVGWGSGFFLSGLSYLRSDGSLAFPDYRVHGLYVRPFVQGVILNVAGVFEWGGGIRIAYTWADLKFSPRDPEHPAQPRGAYEQTHIDPFFLARFRFDNFSIEANAGFMISPGDAQVGPLFNGFASLGLHVHFDTVPRPEPVTGPLPPAEIVPEPPLPPAEIGTEPPLPPAQIEGEPPPQPETAPERTPPLETVPPPPAP